jgi:hypothetical protein
MPRAGGSLQGGRWGKAGKAAARRRCGKLLTRLPPALEVPPYQDPHGHSQCDDAYCRAKTNEDVLDKLVGCHAPCWGQPAGWTLGQGR